MTHTSRRNLVRGAFVLFCIALLSCENADNSISDELYKSIDEFVAPPGSVTGLGVESTKQVVEETKKDLETSPTVTPNDATVDSFGSITGGLTHRQFRRMPPLAEPGTDATMVGCEKNGKDLQAGQPGRFEYDYACLSSGKGSGTIVLEVTLGEDAAYLTRLVEGRFVNVVHPGGTVQGNWRQLIRERKRPGTSTDGRAGDTLVDVTISTTSSAGKTIAKVYRAYATFANNSWQPWQFGRKVGGQKVSVSVDRKANHEIYRIRGSDGTLICTLTTNTNNASCTGPGGPFSFNVDR